MISRPLIVAVLLVSGVTIAAGIVQGKMSGRWGEGADEAAAAQLLEQLPSQIGNWEMTEKFAGEDRVLEMLQCSGYVSRRYQNRITGANVSLALILGPVGPTAAHTPEICYSSKDYNMDSKRELVSVESGTVQGDFWVNRFTRNDVGQHRLIVYYAWYGDDGWKASSYPRWQFADQPFLYKVQVASYLPVSSDGEEDDACKQFLQDLLPAAQDFLAN